MNRILYQDENQALFKEMCTALLDDVYMGNKVKVNTMYAKMRANDLHSDVTNREFINRFSRDGYTLYWSGSTKNGTNIAKLSDYDYNLIINEGEDREKIIGMLKEMGFTFIKWVDPHHRVGATQFTTPRRLLILI